jgi:uncharacterized membrane protein HdeD (DUF308 family)
VWERLHYDCSNPELVVLTTTDSDVWRGIDARVRQANVITGLLSLATGIGIIVCPGPGPGLPAVAIVLGAWLIVAGGITITGAFAARWATPEWWLLLFLGLLEIPLGVLALASPGATLAALVTVAGIWCVFIGVTRIMVAFEIKRLPDDVDQAFGPPDTNGHATAPADAGRAAATT